MCTKKTDHSPVGELCTGFHSHRECMEEDYEYANEFGKQGQTNLKNT